MVYPKNTVITHEIPFVTGCGEDNICTPILNLESHFVNISTLILGSRRTVALTVSVSNNGETAYLTKMNVSLPTQISQFPPVCFKVENMLHCDISNRLVVNQTVSLTVDVIPLLNKYVLFQIQLQFLLDVKHVDALLKELKIDIAVSSAGSGTGNFMTAIATLPIILQSSVTLIGYVMLHLIFT